MELGTGISSQLGLAAGKIFGSVVPNVNVGTPTWFIGNILALFFQFVGVLFLALILWASFKWMTAAGDAEKAESAIKMAKVASFGVAVAFMAFLITEFLFIFVLPGLFQPVIT